MMKNSEANTTHLQISTLNGIFFEGDVRSVSLSTITGGAIVFQPNRSPFISNIAVGKLAINEVGDDDYKLCAIGGGIVYAQSNCVKIITDDIVFSEDIDIDRAKRDRDSALAQLKNDNKKNDVNLELKLRKAISKIDIYSIKK
ncbi:ATP synthase F1 subunit epsilon [Mycoplasma sp. HS2188]|uniref:ATP synthase F1 subunit epsilon n=1 Tax=Mycoplasma sp. HS2188 TaxID=2976765 RepID=UPI0021AA9808|nr:ATP synthase F1 subunit epsilon [Mycoplasma sp. HS2188]MCT4469784.1 ATP synthase F1 subunit epsilon [Mycoplasma sp. HS2188]